MLSTLGRGGAAISILAVWWSASGPWTYLHSFTFRRSDCNRNRNICGGSNYINTAFAMGNCYHTNETPNFHFPHEALHQLQGKYTTAAITCMNTEKQSSGLPSCSTSFIRIHLCDKLHSCGANQTYADLPEDTASDSWVGFF